MTAAAPNHGAVRTGINAMASNTSDAPQSRGAQIRPLAGSDAPFLEEMLYQAIWTPPGEARPPRSVIFQPALQVYVEQWAALEGDIGFMAYDPTDGRDVGAIWLRRLRAPGGYGYWNDETPELSMAVVPEARGRGIGSRLLQAVTSAAACEGTAISLSVAAQNPAVRLYERFGFVTAETRGEALVMVRPPSPPRAEAHAS